MEMFFSVFFKTNSKIFTIFVFPLLIISNNPSKVLYLQGFYNFHSQTFLLLSFYFPSTKALLICH